MKFSTLPRVTLFFSASVQWRQKNIEENRPTNYGVVRLSLLQKIYERLYMQRIYHGSDENAWPHRIIVNATVAAFSMTEHTSKVSLRIRQHLPGHQLSQAIDNRKGTPGNGFKEEERTYDAVILGTGYTRDAYKSLLRFLHSLKPRGADKDADGWQVRRDYSVIFADSAVAPDCGIWLQGCCEYSHGVSWLNRHSRYATLLTPL